MKQTQRVKWFRNFKESSNSHAQVRRERWLNRNFTNRYNNR